MKTADAEFCTECGSKLEASASVKEETVTEDISAPPVVVVSPPKSPKLKSVLLETDVTASLSAGKLLLVAIAGGVVAAIAIVIFVFLAVTRPFYNPPYEVISFGRYDEIHYIGEGRFMVKRGEWPNIRWGVEDIRGNEIIQFGRFDFPEHHPVTEDGNFVIREGRYFRILNSRGNEIATFGRFDHVFYVTENRFLVAVEAGASLRGGVVDEREREIIPIGRFTDIAPTEDGRWFVVWDNDRVGLLDNRGNEVITLGRYDYISAVPNDRFIVTTGLWPNRRWAVLDSRGNEIIPLGRYDSISAAGDNHFLVWLDNEVGVLDARGNEVIPVRYDSIWLTENNFTVTDGDRISVLNLRGQEVIPPGRFDYIHPLPNGGFIVRSGGERDNWTWQWDNARWGALDARGNEIIALGRFDDIHPASDNTFVVRSGGTINPETWELENARWGAIDARGNEIITLGRYDNVIPIDDGFIVRTGNRQGLRDTNGQTIIPQGRYDEIHSIHNNLAIVTQGVRLGVINTRRAA